jgi:hypothetical protein
MYNTEVHIETPQLRPHTNHKILSPCLHYQKYLQQKANNQHPQTVTIDPQP